MMRERAGGDDLLDDLVDDHTYDLLQALTSSLEALDADREFAANAPGSVFDRLVEEERAQATLLLDAVRGRLAEPAARPPARRTDDPSR